MAHFTSTKDRFYDRKRLEDFKEFLKLYSSVRDIGSLDDAYARGVESRIQYKYDSPYEGILKRWKESGDTDFSIYDDEEYIFEAWASWRDCSARYVRLIDLAFDKASGSSAGPECVPFERESITKVLDMGCGIGYSTVALAEVFPNAEAIGSQLEGTDQYNFCKKLFEEHSRVSLVDETKYSELGSVDAIFASEFFEHIKEPIPFMEGVFADLGNLPKVLIVKSTFGNPLAPGHFDKYVFNGELVDGRKMSREFNKYLRSAGYGYPVKKFFNGEPTIWILKDA